MKKERKESKKKLPEPEKNYRSCRHFFSPLGYKTDRKSKAEKQNKTNLFFWVMKKQKKRKKEKN